jgi:hypothetical protein
LKPAKVPDLPTSEPVSGAMWQRMMKDHSKVFGDSIFATELTRLGATGQLTPGEVAIGLRIAGIYGRFEYFKNLSRSAASPYYIREYVSEGAGADSEAINFQAMEGRERDRSFNPDDREEREEAATSAFKGLQACIPMSLRSDVEALCVENIHVGFQQLLAIRQAFAVIGDTLPDSTTGLSKKQRRQLRKKRRPQLAPATKEKPIKVNALKDAFLAVQRRLSPHLNDEELEKAWEVMQTLKSRSDFRLEKSGVVTT